MVKTILLILFTACVGISGLVNTTEIEEILQKPEAEIDLGYACLLLSKDAFPNIDINQGVKFFDKMSTLVSAFVGANKDTTPLFYKRIGALNTYLYRPGPWNAKPKGGYAVYSYDDDNIEHIDMKSLFIPHMLFANKGTCSTMPTLWYIIADRLKWPVHAVRGPGHIWVKYTGIELGNIEATAKGGFIPDTQYIKDMKIGTEAIKNGVYMRPLSKKNFISTLLVNNAFYSSSVLMDTLKAIKYLEIAIKNDSTNAEALANLGLLTGVPLLVKKAKILGLTDHQYSSEFYEKRNKSINRKGKQ